MKTKWNQTGRHFFLCRRPPGSTLLRHYLLFILLFWPACLITSCRGAGGLEQDSDTVVVTVDSCWFHIDCSILNNISEAELPVARLDVLLYDADGVGGLESWTSYRSLPDSIVIRGAKRAKIAVLIANSPRSFSRRGIERYDSVELLSYEFDEDTPEQPLMSGTATLIPGTPGKIILAPLMARVQLCGISNLMTGYVRLEDPRIYLENMNPAAEILRLNGFRPTEILEGRRKKPLPFDVGLFTQNPMTELFCYPNDSLESTMGTPHTTLVLECEINGLTCRFPVDLKDIGRNTTVHVDITVHSPDTFESKVY